MNVFVTGATGFIGVPLCKALVARGHSVHALVRSPSRANKIAHPEVRMFLGHILEPGSLEEGMASCSVVFHLAALARVWSPHVSDFYDINVRGTRLVMEAALRQGVRRVIITSTAGVFGPSTDGAPVNEFTHRKRDFFTEYERTKALADQEAMSYLQKGLEVITLHPTRVYGPGLLSESNAVTQMITRYVKGKWHLIPGNGRSIGNYVYIDDVVQGHILALEKGKSGQQYILGGDNVSYKDLFRIVRNQSGKAYRLYYVPYGVMLSMAACMTFLSWFGFRPLITSGFVRKYSHHWNVDSSHAVKQLDYRPIPVAEGIERILTWIRVG